MGVIIGVKTAESLEIVPNAFPLKFSVRGPLRPEKM
jgi:hypothetical protein